MNEVAKQGASSNLAFLQKNIGRVRSRLPEAGGAGILRFLPDGEWVFGKEDNALPKGTRIAINPLAIKHGYVCWTDREGKVKNKLMDEQLWGLGEDIPMKSEMPEFHDEESVTNPLPWKDIVEFRVKVMSGTYKGQELVYKPSSEGGRNAARSLIDAVFDRVGAGNEFFYPIVELGSDHYTHKHWGRTHIPVLSAVEWANDAGDLEGEALQIEEEPKSTKRRKAKPAPEAEEPEEPEDEDEDDYEDEEPEEQPVRRRRRRSAS